MLPIKMIGAANRGAVGPLKRCLFDATSMPRRACLSTGPKKTGDESPSSSPDKFVDIKTHTGQKFEENDYRLSRFIGKEKMVNTRFAIDLVAEIPPKGVNARFVACEGGGGPLGHPKVFINLDKPGNHSCGYCGLRFYQDHSAHDHDSHGHNHYAH